MDDKNSYIYDSAYIGDYGPWRSAVQTMLGDNLTLNEALKYLNSRSFGIIWSVSHGHLVAEERALRDDELFGLFEEFADEDY